MKIMLSETQYKNLILEEYDAERLYSKNFVVTQLTKGPRELKKYIKNLPTIEHTDDDGNVKIFTKIPQVIYVYLSGKY